MKLEKPVGNDIQMTAQHENRFTQTAKEKPPVQEEDK